MFKIKNKDKAFTLIELLVVIAIIGLLSSVVMASLNSAREKGRIGAGLQFATSQEHARATEAVGIWNFDKDSSGNLTVKDRSGNGFDGIIQGTVSASDDVAEKNKSVSASFNGIVNNRIEIQDNTKSNFFISAPSYDFMFMAWVKPSDSSTRTIFAKAYGPYFRLSGNKAECYLYKTASPAGTITASGVTNIPVLKWSHVACLFNSSQMRLEVYVNGKLDGFSTTVLSTDAIYQYGTTNAYIGVYYYNGSYSNPFFGLIDEVRYYNAKYSIAQIQKIFADSRDKFVND